MQNTEFKVQNVSTIDNEGNTVEDFRLTVRNITSETNTENRLVS